MIASVLTPQRLVHLRTLYDAASPGPWRPSLPNYGDIATRRDASDATATITCSGDKTDSDEDMANSRLIIAMHGLLTDLLNTPAVTTGDTETPSDGVKPVQTHHADENRLQSTSAAQQEADYWRAYYESLWGGEVRILYDTKDVLKHWKAIFAVLKAAYIWRGTEKGDSEGKLIDALNALENV